LTAYQYQPKKLRDKAPEIAGEVLKTTGNKGEAVAYQAVDKENNATIAMLRCRILIISFGFKLLNGLQGFG
jgi:hypothetical protein